MSESDLYEPNSTNAMFSRVLERLAAQDRAAEADRKEIKAQFMALRADAGIQSERVTKLENAQWRQRGFVAAVSLLIPVLWQWFTNSGKS